MFQLDAATIQALLAGRNTTSNTGEEKKDGAADFKISEGERIRMRSMCGLPENCGEEAFPIWYRDLFAKHQDEKDKGLILAAAIDPSFMFDDAEVLLYPSLVKMILK